ncbi:MAG: hypothetical protein JWM63_1915 [Gammaproteobacteria bacterium]|nr:hypothetical protein [Gammaproteobacteria bacterium]
MAAACAVPCVAPGDRASAAASPGAARESRCATVRAAACAGRAGAVETCGNSPAPPPARAAAAIRISASARARRPAGPAAANASDRSAGVPGPAAPGTFRATADCLERGPAAARTAKCSIGFQNARATSVGPATGSTRAHSRARWWAAALVGSVPAAQRRVPPLRTAAQAPANAIGYSFSFTPGALGFGAGTTGLASATVGVLTTLPMSVCER